MSSADVLPPPSKTRYLTVPDTAAKKDSLKQYSVDEVKQVSARTFPASRSRAFHARPGPSRELQHRGGGAARTRCATVHSCRPERWLRSWATKGARRGGTATRQSTEAEGACPSRQHRPMVFKGRYAVRKQNNAAVLRTNGTAPCMGAADADLYRSFPARLTTAQQGG